MALLLIEGVDHYTTAGNMSLKHWVISATGESPPQYVSGRINGNALRVSSTDTNTFGQATLTKVLPSTYATIIAGFAFQTSGYPQSTANFFVITPDSGSTYSVQMCMDSMGHIVIKNSAGTTLATSTFQALGYNYYEIKAFQNGASGTIQVRANGVDIISSTVVNIGSSNWNAIILRRNTSDGWKNSVNLDWDDIYVCDTSGSANNNFLGDVHVETIYPTSDGTHTDWTPNSGVTHYNRVNQTNPDDDTTYNSTATVGNIDSYNYTDLSILGSVFGVQTNLWARKDDATTRQVKALIRSGGSDYTTGATQTLSTSYVDYTDIFEQDPNTSAAWTVSAVNAAEFGVKVIT